MNYLRAENIAKSYGDRVLFKNLTISIEKGQRIALIAKNGTGKTNLLNILALKDQSDAGTVLVSKDIKTAYLEQEPFIPENLTVYEALFNSNNELLQAVAAYEKALEHSETNHDNVAMAGLQRCMEEMDRLQAWDYESRIRQVLTKLAIHQYDQLAGSLSGGQKKRLALARLLINTPDLLIMDEPTNHLDIDMIEWLEGYLKSVDTTLLLVTHDRYFLDNVCNQIIELDQGKLYTYKGNYAYYLEKKAEREFREERETEKARNLMRKELEWIRRQPKARGTKSKSRIDAFYELKEKAAGKAEDKKVELDLKMQRLGGKILELHKVHKAFDAKKLIADFSYILKPGERIGIVGRNGVGKSTFLNMLMGLETPDSGHITRGDTVVYGYYAQTGLQLKEDKRVLDVVKDIAEYVTLNKGEKITASQLCKRFLFDDKMQHTFVSKLSGGEKRRLFLLTVLIKNPNFLILDEPTNDLDIPTLNVLEEFLETYKGCLLIVTHDRYFMDKLVDHLLIFEGEGQIRDFNGNYQDYLNELEELKLIKEVSATLPQSGAGSKQPAVELSEMPLKKKLSYKEQREFEQLEKDISELEIRKADLEAKLVLGGDNHEELLKWSREVEEVNLLLEEKGMRWLELSE
ncbi:MAG: ABC-F family ATP-binding cassette domain-containing protein [Bacteroidota bacterium]